jgi:hypothetical protein
MDNLATVDVGQGDFFHIVTDSLPQEYVSVQLMDQASKPMPVSFILARLKSHDIRLFAARRATDASSIARLLAHHVEEVAKLKTTYPSAMYAKVSFYGMSDLHQEWKEDFGFLLRSKLPTPALPSHPYDQPPLKV